MPLKEAVGLAIFGEPFTTIVLDGQGNCISGQFETDLGGQDWAIKLVAGQLLLEDALIKASISVLVLSKADGQLYRVPSVYWEGRHLSDLPDYRLLLDAPDNFDQQPVFIDGDRLDLWGVVAQRITMPMNRGRVIDCPDAMDLLITEGVSEDWLQNLDKFADTRGRAQIWSWLEAVVWVRHRDIRHVAARSVLNAWHAKQGRKVDGQWTAFLIGGDDDGRQAENDLVMEIEAGAVRTEGRDRRNARRSAALEARDWDGGRVYYNETVDLGSASHPLAPLWAYDIAVERGSLQSAFPAARPFSTPAQLPADPVKRPKKPISARPGPKSKFRDELYRIFKARPQLLAAMSETSMLKHVQENWPKDGSKKPRSARTVSKHWSEWSEERQRAVQASRAEMS